MIFRQLMQIFRCFLMMKESGCGLLTHELL
jgi:hypothetical protein